MSSIVGPSLGSVVPRTILPMDAVTVSRYMDLVESSQTILLALILEILDVILSTADTSVGVLLSDRVGSGIFVLVTMLTKPQVGVEGHPTASVLVSRNAGMVGAPGKWVDGRIEKNWEALPSSGGTPSCQGIPMATGVFPCPSVGGPNTQLNIVAGGGQWLSTGLSISRPSNMSDLVITQIHSQSGTVLLHSLPKDGHLGLSVDKPFLPNAANIGNRLQLEALAFAARLGIPAFLKQVLILNYL